MTSTKQEEKLLQMYARPIVHMRRQYSQKRLAPVLGAGVSKSFGLPGWGQFIRRIAADPAVKGRHVLNSVTERTSLPFVTELLFQHFRKIESQKYGSHKALSLEFENRTAAKWQRICAKHLYKGAPRTFSDQVDEHPYLSQLLPLIQKTALTITYNFDDYLERALREKKPPGDKSRGFETVTNPWMQFRRERGVVYHANGVIKSELMELPVDKFIFSESAFARQKVGAGGDASFLLNHFCKNTCLVIGSSLEDESLRNTLIQSAETSPGNFHYGVYFLRRASSIKTIDVDAIRSAHFKVFNMITLFLTEEEIAALARLIDSDQISDPALEDLARKVKVPLVYRFYLTGAVGVGKSTTARQLGNLSVLDEWLDPRPRVLAKPWDSLTKLERRRADSWIIKQFTLKNDRLRHESIGVFVVDRPPLDPIVFTPTTQRQAKAKLLLDALCAGQNCVIDGVVIILQADAAELSIRVLATGRDEYTRRKIERMQEDLRALYKGAGAFPLDTRGMSVADVTRAIAAIIFFDAYREFALHRRLKRYP